MSTLNVSKSSEGVFAYDYNSLNSLFSSMVSRYVSSDNWQWLVGKARAVQEEKERTVTLNTAFAALPRKTGKIMLSVSNEEEGKIRETRPNLSIHGWGVDRLARVWLLLQIPTDDKSSYVNRIDALFIAAEMNELVALYSSLPLLAYPAEWQKRCAEGIRSNIGIVLESIICNNPYPSEQLPEAAWNQLVMKAFFTEKQIDEIIGLDERRNKELANILTDYAHERWAAGRPVHPLLWRCVGPFINENNIADIKRVIQSENGVEREAAVLACLESIHPAAKLLLSEHSDLLKLAQSTNLSWKDITRKLKNDI